MSIIFLPAAFYNVKQKVNIWPNTHKKFKFFVKDPKASLALLQNLISEEKAVVGQVP